MLYDGDGEADYYYYYYYYYYYVLLLRNRLQNASSTSVFLTSMKKHLRLLGFSGQMMFFVNIAVVGIMFEDQKVLEFRHIKKTMLAFKMRIVGLQG